ncbi:MAG: cyclic nucleotide-binding domain-containing protein [Rhodospirillales bacterium]|nr:cyclic nucleotide-binding domain-containing protein [Rhodospirillales bacterium]
MPHKPHSSPCAAGSPHRQACGQCDIRKDSMCAAVSDDELVRIESLVTHVTLGPGQTVFDEGDPRDFHYNVSDGVVRLFKMLPDGRRQITGFLFPGDHLGLAAHDTYSYSAEAVTDVHLCRFRAADLEALFEDLPDLALRLFSMVNDELAAAQEQIMLLGRKNPTEKLISFLLLMSERNVDRGLPPSPVFLPMRRADVADYLGLTIETVSRAFSRLKKEGVLSLPTDYTVVLENLDLLEELADES